MRAFHRSLALAGFLTLVACAPTPVSRETTAAVEPQTPVSAATSKNLGEIVVTANKRSQAPQDAVAAYATSLLHVMPYPVDRENYGRIDPNPLRNQPIAANAT